MPLPPHSIVLRLFDPEHFCTGQGEETRKLVALPLVMSGAFLMGGKLDRARITAQGTGAVLEIPRTTTARQGGWQKPDVVNLATNIDGVQLARPTSQLMQRSVLMPLPPLGKAMTTPVTMTCVRMVKTMDQYDRVYQMYEPGMGWRSCNSRTWGFSQAIGNMARYFVCKQLGIDDANYGYNRQVKSEDKQKHAKLFEMFDNLKCVNEKGEPEKPMYLEGYLNPINNGYRKMDRKPRAKTESRRYLIPEDLAEAGYIDNAEDVRIHATDEYGSEHAPKMYKLKLKPLMALPKADFLAGRVPASVLSTVKGTTIDDLLETLAESKLDWPVEEPNLQWVQIAMARVYPNDPDKY